MDNIYIIDNDFSHVSDLEVDAYVVPFSKSIFFPSLLMGTNEFDHPEIIFLRGDFDILQKIDYLITDSYLPLFSKKMLSILKSLGSFKHRTIPCGITDYLIDPEDSYDDFKNSIVKPGIEVNRDFEILHLLEVLDILDWDKSDLIMDDDYPDELLYIKKYIFKEPEGGYSPVFRLKKEISCLFIPESTKKALDDAGIRGIRYEKVPQ